MFILDVCVSPNRKIFPQSIILWIFSFSFPKMTLITKITRMTHLTNNLFLNYQLCSLLEVKASAVTTAGEWIRTPTSSAVVAQFSDQLTFLKVAGLWAIWAGRASKYLNNQGCPIARLYRDRNYCFLHTKSTWPLEFAKVCDNLLLAPKVLLDYLRTMITIPSNQSRPIPAKYSCEDNLTIEDLI